jgi:hypothetical protein
MSMLSGIGGMGMMGNMRSRKGREEEDFWLRWLYYNWFNDYKRNRFYKNFVCYIEKSEYFIIYVSKYILKELIKYYKII